MRQALINVASNSITQVNADNTTFPVHPKLKWVEFNEANHDIHMGNMGQWVFDGTNFSEADPWPEFPTVDLAREERKKIIRHYYKSRYNEFVDAQYLEHYRKERRSITPNPLPDSAITDYEDGLKEDWQTAKTDLDAMNDRKAIREYDQPHRTPPNV